MPGRHHEKDYGGQNERKTITPPLELFYFPEKNRIAGSERYIIGGILGHAFLDRGMVCNYRIQGQKVTAFVTMLPSPRDAVYAVKQLRTFFNIG